MRAILEEVLLDVMYDLPGRHDIGKCVIDRAVVLKGVNPTLVPLGEPPRPSRSVGPLYSRDSAGAGSSRPDPADRVSLRVRPPRIRRDSWGRWHSVTPLKLGHRWVGDDRHSLLLPQGEAVWLDRATSTSSRRCRAGGLCPTLDRMCVSSCTSWGTPERTYPSVHLTGTNAKGSTAAMITSLFDAMGLSVGTYTSPNLSSINERIAHNGVPIDDESFASVLALDAGRARTAGERPADPLPSC